MLKIIPIQTKTFHLSPSFFILFSDKIPNIIDKIHNITAATIYCHKTIKNEIIPNSAKTKETIAMTEYLCSGILILGKKTLNNLGKLVFYEEKAL